MTLTLDRKAELLSAVRLFDGIDAEGMDRIAAVAVQVDFPAHHVVARSSSSAPAATARLSARTVARS